MDSKPIDPPPPGESPHPADTPTHTHPTHSGADDQHGVPVVGYPPGNEHTSLPLQNEPAGNDHCSHHGVPMVGLVPPFPHAGTHPPHADQNNDIAGGTSESHCGAPTVGLTDTSPNDNGTLSHADLGSKELVAVPHPHENEALTPASIKASAQCSAHEHAPAEAVRSRPNDYCNKINPSCSYADSLRPPISGESGASHSSLAKEKDASPPKRAKYSKIPPYAIISLFDGVGSAIPAITKAIGCAPRIIIVAECDPILRQLVGEQFSLRTDGEWTQSSKDTYTLYADDVRQLLRNQCRILKEAFALAGPHCRWFVIAGSPCQDLTPAGPLKGLLGLTGHCSSLFYYVHVILWLVQMNYPLEHIRFLLENAGAMLDIHRKAILRALGLNPDSTPDSFRVDPKNTHGIRRNRFYFRNYQDCVKVSRTVVLKPSDIEEPLVDFNGHPIPFRPLLRVRSVLGHNVYQLSWTVYQPISLIWDYLFWGDKAQFQLKAKMHTSGIISALDFEKSLPPHYLRAWNRFLQSLRQTNVSTIDRDRLVRAILPIYAFMPPATAHSSSPSDAPAPKARRIAHPANCRSADDWVTALQNSRASFLATTAVPEDPAEAMRGGLLLTPLLGCKARTPLDWTHAWAMLGEWAGAIAFLIPEQGEWPRHGDGRYLRPDFVERTPPFLTWARPIFEQGALSPMSVFPADFPILCLPGDKLFQSKELAIGYSLPPIVHAFHGSKVGLGHQLQQWQSKGLQPLAVSLIGVDEAPPLWTHPTGCDFVRGSKIVAKPHVPQKRSLTKTQVLLLQSLWTPVEAPNSNNDHAPWPKTCEPAYVFCGQHASLQLPAAHILPLLEALQRRLEIDPSNAELAINEILASHTDPKYTDWKIIVMDNTSWQLNDADPGSLDVQCTGLGGGELDEDWDVLLACKKEVHVYGPSLSKQDDWNARAGTVAGTAHMQEYLLLHIAMFPIGAHIWCRVLECPVRTNCRRRSSAGP